ncbi:glycoside hydrolase superfamily [Trichoderma barbatum]
MAKSKIILATWNWRLANSNGNKHAENLPGLKDWTAVTVFPSVIQTELTEKNIIPDINIAENEYQTHWVGEVDWEYQSFFNTPPEATDNDEVDLVMEGLDTFATVYLNGTEIYKSDNMFIPARVPVKDALNSVGEQNELVILFESPMKLGTELLKKSGIPENLPKVMKDPRRLVVRKAQCHWGWDWGPVCLTAGPYLPVYLEAYRARINDVYIVPKLAEDHSTAQVSVSVEVAQANRAAGLDISVLDALGEKLYQSHVILGTSDKVFVEFTVVSPKLWWSNGLGYPHLYTAKVTLRNTQSALLDESCRRFGIRSIGVVQKPLDNAPGKTFMFKINGRDIFAQGGNWIPADTMLPTLSRQRYFEWMKLAKFANLNMVRVWGGGIYEPDDFFDACDEMGILVWQDFALACGIYPVHEQFLDSFRREAEIQTRRIRSRASLALLSGGNEDFILADHFGFEYDRDNLTGPWDPKKPFAHRKIYLDVLPKLAAKLAPDTQFWANSPYGGASPNDTTIGDVHQWAVWHLDQRPYQDYKDLSGRFISEFGMHGFPVNRTVDHFLRGIPKSQQYPQSRVVDCHNKSTGAHTRIARYLAENFRFDIASLKNFGYSSQLMQSEAYCYALRDWKRQFNGPGDERCAGALIWQLNDIYPVTSWAFVDYFLRPKPAFYPIRRVFAPISVGIERTPNSRCPDVDDLRDSYIPFFEIFAHNTSNQHVVCALILQAYHLDTGAWTQLSPSEASRVVTLRAGYNTELGQLGAQASWTEDTLILLEASLVDIDSGVILAREINWPEPFRYLVWPEDTKLNIRVEEIVGQREGEGQTWENKVTIVSNQALKGVWLEVIYDGAETDDEPEPLWEDNMVDLLPGQEISFRVKGLRGREVTGRFLYDWEIAALK